MTQPDVDLVTAQIREHAGRVDQQAELIKQAHRAAHEVSMHTDAYGIICSPIIVPLLKFFEGDAVTSIGETATTVESLADLLRVVATNTDVTDEIARNRMRGGR